jgi:hypothetical protein
MQNFGSKQHFSTSDFFMNQFTPGPRVFNWGHLNFLRRSTVLTAPFQFIAAAINWKNFDRKFFLVRLRCCLHSHNDFLLYVHFESEKSWCVCNCFIGTCTQFLIQWTVIKIYNNKVAKISENFCNNSKWPNGILKGPGKRVDENLVSYFL